MEKTKNHFHKGLSLTKDFFKTVWIILNKPEMAILPGQIAFFLILSLVPIITLFGYGASYFNISLDSIAGILKNNFGNQVVNLIMPIISGKSIDLKLVSVFILMFYVASKGPASIIVAANEIYGIEQSPWVRRRLKAIILTIILVILYIFIIIVPVLGEKIIDAIDYFNIKSMLTNYLSILRGPISWVIIFVFIYIIFKLAPDKKIKSPRITFGAIFTTVGWILVTYLYGYYASHFAKYDLFYAGLSNIAVLMLWFYFLSYILVIGLSLTTTIDNDKLVKKGSIKKEE